MNEPLTKEVMEGFKANGRPHTFIYDNIQGFQNALRHAYYVKKTHPREDGGRYEISQTSATGTIIIRVTPPRP